MSHTINDLSILGVRTELETVSPNLSSVYTQAENTTRDGAESQVMDINRREREMAIAEAKNWVHVEGTNTRRH